MNAYIGLIGVLVGAVLGGAIQYGLAIRRERQAARVASRVVLGELRHAETMFMLAAEGEAWPKPSPSLYGWVSQSAALAAAIDNESWARLDMICQSIIRYLTLREADHKTTEEWLEEDRELLGVMRRFAQQGIAILQPVSEGSLWRALRTGDPPPITAQLAPHAREGSAGDG